MLVIEPPAPGNSELCPRPVVSTTIKLCDVEHHLRGREAWALDQLIIAGDGGCTPITHPGPRWSDYVFKLRKRGLSIETIDEKHGGPFSGLHARYVLHSPVSVIAVQRQGDGQ
jgi:hypothetical protein